MRLQQYSGPVMAKGLEDTAFYRYNRFIALNEVGGHPRPFGLSLAELPHRQRRAGQALAARHAGHLDPRHQARRGHAGAARGAVRIAGRMGRSRSHAWSRLLRAAARRRRRRPRRPTATTNICSTQLLVGTWPLELLDGDAPTPERARRLRRAAQGRHDQVHARGQGAFDLGHRRTRPTRAATLAFVDAALTGQRAAAFLPPSCPSRRGSRGSACTTASCRPCSS